MQLIWICWVWTLAQLGETKEVYEADLRDFNAEDYSTFLPNPTTLRISKYHHKVGITAQLSPFVDNGASLPLGHIQFFLGSPTPVPVSSPFLRAYWRMGAQLDVHWRSPPQWKAGVSHKHDDPRLGNAAAVLVDPTTGIVADFFLTNHGIWAFYERLPIALATLGPYQSFGQIRRICSRNPDDVHDLSIEYDAKSNRITWFVGLKAVASVEKLGVMTTDRRWRTGYVLKTGGAVEVRPEKFVVALASFSLMDFADPWREGSSGLIARAAGDSEVFSVPGGWISQSYDGSLGNYVSSTFGQGVWVRLEEMEAHAHSH